MLHDILHAFSSSGASSSTGHDSKQGSAHKLLSPAEGTDPLFIGLLIVVSIYLGLFFRICLRKIPLPYTLICLMLGIGIGRLEGKVGLSVLGDSIANWRGLDPHTIIFIFLPPLIFESAASMDFHTFYASIYQSLILAIPGVLISAGLTALVAMYIFPYNWDFVTSMTLGSILAATDPVAVVALLKELGAPKTLGTVIEGESLLNDGVAFVLFEFFHAKLQGEELTTLDFGTSFTYMGLVGFFGGWVAGRIVVKLMGIVFDDSVTIIMLSVSGAFGTFYALETIHASSVLGMVGFGLALASSACGNISHQAEESFEIVWECMGYLANTMVFVYSGIIIVHYQFSTDYITRNDYMYLLILYCLLNVIRGVTLIVLAPFLMCTGYGFDWKKLILFTWGGLRGAVGLTLGLLLVTDRRVDEKTSVRIMFYIAGIAGLTLFINGTTCGILVKALRLNRSPGASRVAFSNVVLHFNNHIDEKIAILRRNEFYKGVDWSMVWQSVPILDEKMNELMRKRIGHIPEYQQNKVTEKLEREVEASFEHDDNINKIDLIIASRERYLDVVQAFYTEEFEKYALECRPAFQILKDASKMAQDNPLKVNLEWKTILNYCKLTCLEKLTTSAPGHRLVVEKRVAIAFELTTVFIKARAETEESLNELINNHEVIESILQESHAQVKLAQDFLDEINTEYCFVLGAIKTHWAKQRLALEALSFVSRIRSEGGINDKEFNCFMSGLYVSKAKTLKRRFMKCTPISNMQVLQNSSLFENLNVKESDKILSKFHCKTFDSGEYIAQENTQPRGIYVLTGGRVSMLITTNGKETHLRNLTSGDVIGDVAIVTGRNSKWSMRCETPALAYFMDFDKIEYLLEKYKGKQFERNIVIGAGLKIISSLYTIDHSKSLTAEQQYSIDAAAKLVRPSSTSSIISKDGGIGVLLRGKMSLVSMGEERKIDGDYVIDEVCKFDFNGQWHAESKTCAIWIPPEVSWICDSYDQVHFEDSQGGRQFESTIMSGKHGAWLASNSPIPVLGSANNSRPGSQTNYPRNSSRCSFSSSKFAGISGTNFQNQNHHGLNRLSSRGSSQYGKRMGSNDYILF